MNVNPRTSDPGSPVARRLTRRNLITAFAIAPAIAAFLAACGDRDEGEAVGTDGTAPGGPDPSATPTTTPADPTSAPTTAAPAEVSWSTEPGAVVLTSGTEGGFVTMQYNFARQPNVVITGDGRVFTPAVTTLQYPGPLVAPINVQTITPDGIEAILQLARSSGLLGEIPDYSSPNDSTMADLPDQVVVIHTSAGSFVHRAYALGVGADEEAPEEYPARMALRSFVEQVENPDAIVSGALGEPQLFAPAEYRILATPYGNDASDPDADIRAWPATAGVRLADASVCTRVPADAIAAVVADAREDALFREDGTLYSLAVAAVLPSDVACPPAA